MISALTRFWIHTSRPDTRHPLKSSRNKLPFMIPNPPRVNWRKMGFPTAKCILLQRNALSYRKMHLSCREMHLSCRKMLSFWGPLAGGLQGSRIKNASQLSQDKVSMNNNKPRDFLITRPLPASLSFHLFPAPSPEPLQLRRWRDLEEGKRPPSPHFQPYWQVSPCIWFVVGMKWAVIWGGCKTYGGRKTYQRTHSPGMFWTPPKVVLVCSVVDFCTGKTEH